MLTAQQHLFEANGGFPTSKGMRSFRRPDTLFTDILFTFVYLLLGVIIISPTPCQGHDYHQSTIYFEPMMPKPFNHGLNASGYFAHTFTSHALLEKRISLVSPRRFTALMRAFSVHSCAADEIDNITADTITPRKTSAAPWLPSPSFCQV